MCSEFELGDLFSCLLNIICFHCFQEFVDCCCCFICCCPEKREEKGRNNEVEDKPPAVGQWKFKSSWSSMKIPLDSLLIDLFTNVHLIYVYPLRYKIVLIIVRSFSLSLITIIPVMRVTSGKLIQVHVATVFNISCLFILCDKMEIAGGQGRKRSLV